MRFKNFDIIKSLRLPQADAQWLSAASIEYRKSESEIIRVALQALRRLHERQDLDMAS